MPSSLVEMGTASASLDAAPRHAVQFYESLGFLAHGAGAFLCSGLHEREQLIVAAETPHWQLFERELHLQGFDVPALRRARRIVWVDARETLARVMAGSLPDGTAFSRTLDALFGRLADHDGARVRVFGEMVDILLRDGNPEAALRLEQFWNEELRVRRMSLLCSYSIDSFVAGTDFLDRACGSHDHVMPAESYSRIEDWERQRWEIVSLQVRARALQAEIHRRQQLERSLRDMLAERQRLLGGERTARAEAEAANRVKDEFLGVLSHELRTPLNAILGWADLISRPGGDSSKVAFGLDVIKRNAMVQLRAIDALLDVSRIVGGGLHLRADPVDLVAVVNAAVDGVRAGAVNKGIGLDVRIAGVIAPVVGDAGRLQQAVSQLLLNAVKFTPEHGRVEVSVRQDGGAAHVAVRDDGQGIAESFLPYVFDRFRQGEGGLARRHGGLGLGLAIVRHVIEAHGGSVWATSDGEGRGATFGIDLPVTPLDRSAAAVDSDP